MRQIAIRSSIDMENLSPFRDAHVHEFFLKNTMVRTNTPCHWLIRAPCLTAYRINLTLNSAQSFIDRVNELLSAQYIVDPPRVFQIDGFAEMVCIGTQKQPPAVPSSKTNKWVIIDVKCASALLRGAHIYAPGVIGIERSALVGDEVYVYADLNAQCRQGFRGKIESVVKYFIGIGQVAMWPKTIFAPNASGGIAVRMLNTISGVPPLGNLSIPNKCLLQNIPSIVTVRVLDPQPGEIILDMCAAPGNKTTHIAELMNKKGIVVALDRSKNKMRKFQQFVCDHELSIIRPIIFDSTMSFSCDLDNNNTTWKPPYKANTFDRVLIDAPCSGLGKRPLLMQEVDMESLKSYPTLQKKLLFAGVNVLKLGGILVYSTCTINEKENEHVVAWVLRMFPGLCLLDATPRIGSGGWTSQLLTYPYSRLCQRFDAQSSVDTIGFFIAKFQKTRDINANCNWNMINDSVQDLHIEPTFGEYQRSDGMHAETEIV